MHEKPPDNIGSERPGGRPGNPGVWGGLLKGEVHTQGEED